MEDMEEKRSLEPLRVKAGQGVVIREWVKHPGFALYHAKLKETIEKYQHAFLKGNLEKARKSHAKAQGMAEALQILVKFQKVGAIAKSEIQKHDETL